MKSFLKKLFEPYKTIIFKALAITSGIMTLVLLAGLAYNLMIPKVEVTVDDQEFLNISDQVIQINVLNACGKPGLADKIRSYLREKGFDVVEIGNYHQVSDTTVVLDRMGDSLSCEKTAFALGLAGNRIISAIDSSLFLRSTVVIGKDFADMKPFK